MDKQSENKPSKGFTNWDELAAQKLSEPVNNDLNRLPIQEAKLWSLRWAIMIVVPTLLLLLMVCSIVLYLFTRSAVALLIPTGLTASIFVVVRYAGRFAFWGENDYRLAAKKLELKAKKLEMKRGRKKKRQHKPNE
jgi:hypothetical protein